MGKENIKVIEEINELKENILKGNLNVQTLRDFQELEQKIVHLKKEYMDYLTILGMDLKYLEKTENLEEMFLYNNLKFVNFLSNSLLQIEDKFNLQISTNQLKTIMENIAIAWTYHACTHRLNEILIYVGIDRENPVLEMPSSKIRTKMLNDSQGKYHFISLYYAEEFENLVQKQQKIKGKYQLAKSFILSRTRQNDDAPYEDFQKLNNEIEKHKQQFVYGKFIISTPAGWQAFIENANDLNTKYKEAMQKIVAKRMSISSFPNFLKNKEYIQKLIECLNRIQISAEKEFTEDDALIVEAIKKICEWTDINAGITEIETRAKTTKDITSVITLPDYFEHYHMLRTNEQQEFVELVKQQERCYDSYIKANELVFGVPMEENLEAKR